MSILLSLVPLSYMAASIRDLVNIHFFSTTISSIHSNLCPTLNIEEDIVMASTREKIPECSKNTSRDLFVISTTSSKLYYEHMKIQNLNSLWFGQVEDECFPQSLGTNVGKSNIFNGLVTGSNPKSKQCEDNMALAPNNMRPPSIENMTNSQYALDTMHFEIPIN